MRKSSITQNSLHASLFKRNPDRYKANGYSQLADESNKVFAKKNTMFDSKINNQPPLPL
jgi:hypothetical protein